MDIEAGVEELGRSSFVELQTSSEDTELFISVPLVAALFGKRKLATSTMRTAIESDLQLLQAFGATRQSEINRGMHPRIARLFSYVAGRITQGKDTFDEHAPMLEFIARKYSPAWLMLARLCLELDNLEGAKAALRRFIEAGDVENEDKAWTWEQLALISQQTGDPVGEIHALVEMCQLPEVPFRTISNAVNRVNALFSIQYSMVDSDEKRIISRELAEVMESRIAEADATDCSRLGWLYMRLGDKHKARQIAETGLELDPDNIHCQNVLSRISSLHV
jgi:tetratricopeptide (TPR) repeat protein